VKIKDANNKLNFDDNEFYRDPTEKLSLWPSDIALKTLSTPEELEILIAKCS
jgi:hypothetical protein